jgi:hypothetical protein
MSIFRRVRFAGGSMMVDETGIEPDCGVAFEGYRSRQTRPK